MQSEQLLSRVKSQQWDELEAAWLGAIDQQNTSYDTLIGVIDAVVKAGKDPLANTLGWAWLSSLREKNTPEVALKLGRGLLPRLPDGETLRDEILALYQQTHGDRPDLEKWLDRSGLKSGKSVRRALRYLDIGLNLAKGCFLMHRSEDKAVQIKECDFDLDEVILTDGRRLQTCTLEEVVQEYDLADDNNFHVLQQFNPQKIDQLATDDPIKLVEGILHSHHNRIDRDELKLILVPKHVPKEDWSHWWSRIRSGVKKSPHLRLEGRSPMYLIYDPAGRTPEQEAWATLSEATSPRRWLDVIDGYLRDVKHRKVKPDPTFLERAEAMILERAQRFTDHNEPQLAFGTALIFHHLLTRDIPISDSARELASQMLKSTNDPLSLVISVGESRLWGLAMKCVEYTFPDRWPELFAQMIPYAPGGLCETLAQRVEKADEAKRLPTIVDYIIAEPGRYTDAMMWLWNGPGVKTPLPIPPSREMLNMILALVGPARLSEGKAVGQTNLQMRAKVRAGLSAKNYAAFHQCLQTMDTSQARTVRRQIERAEGLGPSAQGDMLKILGNKFPDMYVAREVLPWEDDTVLYFTSAGLKAKESARDELVNVKMRENAKAIGEAAAHGDLSENSEYKFALEERDLLRARLAQINQELSIAKVIEPGDIPTDIVCFGQHVTLQPESGGQPVVMTILGAGDSDVSARTYSYQTPVAQQILGKRLGDRIQLALDGNAQAAYDIAKIEPALK